MPVPPPLLPHQQTALAGLRLFAAGDRAAGLVVAPTGAGKSRVAACWLRERVRVHGERVLWVAHRDRLLDQAALELRATVGGTVPRLRGGELGATREPVVVASVGSLRRALRGVRAWARRGPSWLVLDEAHHAPAASFRAVLEAARTAGARVVGLTATPTRTARHERPALARLFDEHVIARVELQPLVERSVLARATLVRLSTHTDADAGVPAQELRRLARTGDLAPSWLRRLAGVAKRNRVVVEHIAENRARYGPTIVIAHDVLHAALLARQLQARGLRADYATAERPDGSSASITEVIQRFERAQLDVIVGVAALDEGVDLVRARTVVMARPTSSEIRFRQCVGRVLRGPALGGDPVAYVVLVEDHWSRVPSFHVPIELVPDLFPEETTLSAREPGARARQLDEDTPSFELAAKATDALALLSHPSLADEDAQAARIVIDLEGRSRIIPVAAAQLEPWTALRAALQTMSPRELRHADAESLRAEHFSPLLDIQAPALADVTAYVAASRATGRPPAIERLDAVLTPYDLALAIRRDDLGERGRTALLERAYAGGSGQLVYGSLGDLRVAVDAVLARLMTSAAA